MHCHNLVEFEMSYDDELLTHDSIQHFVEVNEAVVDVDAHFKHKSVEFFFFYVIIDAHL